MEKELNIAAILNDKPTETKLWSPMLGDCIYCYNNTYPEEIIIAFTDKNGEEKEWTFSYSGRTISAPDTADVCLFPSKQMQDWSKFAWKKGDVLVSNDGDRHIIFKGFSKNDYTTFEGKHWISVSKKRHISYLYMQNTQDYHIEDDKDAAQAYINTIEQRLGGKLNLETLKIEKPQPEFKDGDIVVYGKSIAICRKIYNRTIYFYVSIDETFGLLSDDNRVSAEGYRFATEEEKQRLFEALAKEGKRWNAKKKVIEDIKKEYQFEPFEKVLARDSKDSLWHIDLYEGMLGDDNEYNYSCMASYWVYCIPYEGNEHLLGTTKDVEEDYEGNQE